MAPLPVQQVRDMTGGALRWVNETYPGAFFADAGVHYVCVAGRAVRGTEENAVAAEIAGDPVLATLPAKQQPRRSTPRYAFDSYTQVRGQRLYAYVRFGRRAYAFGWSRATHLHTYSACTLQQGLSNFAMLLHEG